MKPFNLIEAINGKAFYLENGYRGVIKYCVDDFITHFEQPPHYPYVGYVLDDKGFLFTAHTAWNENGKSNEYPSFNATTMVDDTPQQDKGQTMKPFNLEKALTGEHVLLRGGQRAVVLYCIPDKYKSSEGNPSAFPLQGLILDAEGLVDEFGACWRKNGTYNHPGSLCDIIGMWEEPKLTTEEIMEKAFQEKLIIRHSLLLPYHKGFKVVGKTRDGDYILQDCDGSKLSFLCVFNKDIEWSIEK